jgi:hypothetical protein
MKPANLQTIIWRGVAAGLFIGSSLAAADNNAQGKGANDSDLLKTIETAESGDYSMFIITDEEIREDLSPEALKTYNSLSEDGKRLARIVASNKCENTNACKGLNSCKTEKNACQGKGNCKGQSKCAIQTKDLAVELVAKRMAEKRSSITNSRQ